jgi:shikimate kinase
VTCIFLIGFMASGKSTVGRALSKKIGASFYDTDAEIESREGLPIPELFRCRGEGYFRELESRMLQDLAVDCGQGRRVIATGGGLPCTGGNMSLMKRRGITVYLRLTIDEIMLRVDRVQDRPVYDRAGNRDALAALLKERETFYNRADITVDNGGASSPLKTAETITCLLKTRYGMGNG